MSEQEQTEFSNTDKGNLKILASANEESKGNKRLGALFGISKSLTTFESVNKTFPEILNLVAETFPIYSAVLVENRGGSPNTTIWPVTGLKQEDIERIVSKAREIFNYFRNATPSESSDLQSDTIEIGNLDKNSVTKYYYFPKEKNLLAFPLVVDKNYIFGVLQFEGIEPSNEEDLKFANALVNLIAVAFDRYYRTIEERNIREEFVQMLSHDLRTPLSAISMAAQLLESSEALTPEDLALVKRQIVNTKRIDQMTKALLDANRLKVGEKLSIHAEECNLQTVVEEVIADQNEFADEKIKFEEREAVKGYWDSDALRRIVENLVGNAIKYGAKETPINVSLKNTGEGALLTVHNMGNPIPPKEQETIFDQFHRTKSAEEKGKVGWGLGLTLVRGLTESHGGKVWVESEKAKGTTFFVQLPYDSRPKEKSAVTHCI